MSDERSLKDMLGDVRYQELVSAAHGTTLFGLPVSGMTQEELMVALSLTHELHQSELQRSADSGRRISELSWFAELYKHGPVPT